MSHDKKKDKMTTEMGTDFIQMLDFISSADEPYEGSMDFDKSKNVELAETTLNTIEEEFKKKLKPEHEIPAVEILERVVKVSLFIPGNMSVCGDGAITTLLKKRKGIVKPALLFFVAAQGITSGNKDTIENAPFVFKKLLNHGPEHATRGLKGKIVNLAMKHKTTGGVEQADEYLKAIEKVRRGNPDRLRAILKKYEH